jgi:hypothetical protein
VVRGFTSCSCWLEGSAGSVRAAEFFSLFSRASTCRYEREHCSSFSVEFSFLSVAYLAFWTFESVQLFSEINFVHHPIPQAAAVAAVPIPRNHVGIMRLSNSNPDVVYLSEGDSCAICLVEFPKECEALARAREVQVLRDQHDIVVLRCGHPLHSGCAGQIASLKIARHCPLCREPLNLEGSIAARMFH